MATITFRRVAFGLLLAGCLGSGACGKPSSGGSNWSNGAGGPGGPGGSGGAGGVGGQSSGANGSGGSGGVATSSGAAGSSGSAGGSGIGPGGVTATSMPWDAKTASDAVRKVKNLLVGLPPTDADVMLAMNKGPAGLQQLIDTWMTDPTSQPLFQAKMVFFFRNVFQQIGFTPTVDFQPQLLQNGGFDFGPFGVSAVGDDVFARLVQNLQDMFALTAWQLIQDGHSFLETLTTQKYMMTTGLKSLYTQIEMPNDQPFAFGTRNANPLKWTVNYSGTAIPLTDTLNPSNPNYMVFDDEAPVNPGRFFGGGTNFPTCHGSTTTPTGSYTGYAQLFQRLLGYTPRFPFSATPTCWEHPSKPYFTAQDMSDWQWVTIQAKTSADAYVAPYDIPTLRTTTTLKLALPRIGFFTTPAYLALWNTNDSNQHRVTANQTLLAALGVSFTSEDKIVPLNETGLDSAHATGPNTLCYGCHKALDPMRTFWANQLDFNDRNDFLTNTFSGAAPNPRPSTTGGVLAFQNVNSAGMTLLDFGTLLGQVNDTDPNAPLNQFAVGVTQKLCFFANSAPCDTTDPEFRRVVGVFQQAFNFPALIKELFSSPLVTGAVATQTFGQNAVPVSVSRRDHFCQALSNRLGIADVCALAAPLPTTAQAATATIAGTVVADTFSRGATAPITPSEPNLFFRAAVEELCQNLAPQVVDSATPVWSSSSASTAIPDMVQKIMGYPPSDTNYAMAVSILQSHMQSAQAQSNASTALRSTFVLACESPTSVAVGL
jgi:hypothetical protein